MIPLNKKDARRWSEVFSQITDPELAVFLAVEANIDQNESCLAGLLQMAKAKPARAYAMCDVAVAKKDGTALLCAIELLPDAARHSHARIEDWLNILKKKGGSVGLKFSLAGLRIAAQEEKYGADFNKLVLRVLPEST